MINYNIVYPKHHYSEFSIDNNLDNNYNNSYMSILSIENFFYILKQRSDYLYSDLAKLKRTAARTVE